MPAPAGAAGRARASLSLCLAFAAAASCVADYSQPQQPGGSTPFGPGPRAPGGAAGVGGAAGGPGGAGGGDAPVGVASPLACAEVGSDASELPLRRLSALEYQLTLQDLFRLPAPPSVEGIPPDTDKDGFRTYAALQSISAQHLRGYLEVATRLADELLKDMARRGQVIGCELTAADCLSAFVSRFGKLAFRRPLEAAERDAITRGATDNALDVEDRYRYAIESLLVSSNFLYRVEVGDKPEGLSTLRGHELASRLSFALWGRAPSEELLNQAAQGALDREDGLRQAAATLAADPRTRLFFDSFFKQWLGFEELRAPKRPPTGWSDSLLADMTRETEDVLGDFAWSGRNFLDVLTTSSTRLTPALARFYGLPAPAADGAVEIPESHARAGAGLLTHASLLSAKSDGDRIAIRGNWLRKTFLCKPLAVPPEVAEDFGELLVGLTRTQIVQKRNMEAACKGCHASIDPIGIGFERFDEAGRYDPSVDIAPFGLTPAFPDAKAEFDSIAELAALLRADPQVSACLTERVFLYANGREPTRADSCALDAATKSFDGSTYDFRALLRGMVESPSFRLRRAPPQTL
jgi:Protein of unknown function (DUF1592)/Protein of unknown function (DUF1588)/Protein of unknown function (DUF1585)/Protein of unknown function (DUF1587)/Protein of unknown function (DUF1595)